MVWSSLPVAAGLAVGCTLASRTFMHWFQLESYQLPGYFRSLRRKWKEALLPGLLLTPLAALLRFGLEAGALWQRLAGGVLLAFFGWAVGRLTAVDKAKKKFAVTARVKRLGGAMILVCFLLLLPGFWDGRRWLLPLALPLLLALAALAVWPVERCIYELYFQDARRKLKARPDLTVIGITGSYGKTSVKFILHTMLSVKYQVLTTPSSFNTPMGLTRVIREKLDNTHQVFIAEMGARHVGDIKELVDMVHPTVGLLTSVGPQHLETFHDIETVARTKNELIEGIEKVGGTACFALDGAWVSRLFEQASCKKMSAGLKGAKLDMRADDVTCGPFGSQFTLRNAYGETVRCTTRLLGRHNIQNITLAACAAAALGMSMQEIARGIARIEPVEHRLQLISTVSGSIIDDAFNSNPDGAKAALEVLSQFEGRHIVVTPGMVEQGENEAALNREFGRQMAGAAHVAVLVGKKHTRPIQEGLIEAGMKPENIYVVSSLDEATGILSKVSLPGDVVLFENDLPDNYNEI